MQAEAKNRLIDIRKNHIILIVALSVNSLSLLRGQNINNNLRSQDNNRAIAADSSEWAFHRKIKEIPLSERQEYSRITFGGEIRQQMRAYYPVNFGDVPDGQEEDDIFLNQRYMLHTDFHLNRTVRLFTQFNSNRSLGKNSITTSDQDLLDITQAFIEFNIESSDMSLRIGRQELSYGVERMIGTSDGPNVRQNYDGLKYTFHLKSLTGDLLAIRPVKNSIGVFDNRINVNNLVYGGYMTVPLKGSNTFEMYYLRNILSAVCLEKDTVDEVRNSFGLRISRSKGSFYYDTEATVQTGIYNDRKINAWHLSCIAGYRWTKAALEPRIQIKATIFSGNKDSTHQEYNFFRPVSARPPVHNMVSLGPANIIQLAPEAELRLSPKTLLMVRYFSVWRYSEYDGLYSPKNDRLTRGPDESGQEDQGIFVTKGMLVQLDYTASRHFSFSLSGGYFAAGEYIENTGKGKDIKALFLTGWYRF